MGTSDSDPRDACEINHLREIPSFASEAEEREFWATHSLGDGMFEDVDPLVAGELPPPRRRPTPVGIRFDDDTLARLKVLADRKGLGYQTLLKQFVQERLYEEEQRAHLVGGRSSAGPNAPPAAPSTAG